jgi:superfamily II DNA or RNA helicase
MSELQITKDVIQKEALLAWLANGSVGSVILPTGTGKTKLGALAALAKIDEVKSILVVTSRVPLIQQWQDTFKAEMVPMERVEFACIASAYKYNAHYDLVIVDEVHKSLSPMYRKLYQGVSCKFLLCLTATVPKKDDYANFLESVAPIRYVKTIDEIKDASQVTNPYMVYNLYVPFEGRMKATYSVFNKKFLNGVYNLSTMMRKYPELKGYTIFDVAQKFSKFTDKTHPLVTHAKDFWTGMTMRKQAVYSNPQKIFVAKQIVDAAPPTRRFLLFTKSIAFAERVCAYIPSARIYHSNLDSLQRAQVLEDFKNKKFRCLVAVDALNEGVDIPDVDTAICLSGVSTELVSVQQLGRITRVSPNKPKAIFINLVTKDTVEKNWVKEKTSKLSNSQWINNIKSIKW